LNFVRISFWLQLFYSPGWLACRLELADATWCHHVITVMPIQVQVPIQVQANKFNWHQPVDLTVFPVRPPPVRLCFPDLAPGGPVEAPPRRMLLLRPRPDAAAAPASDGVAEVAGVAAAASAVSASCARWVSTWSSNLLLTTLDLAQQLAP